jgi:hypothetical protein
MTQTLTRPIDPKLAEKLREMLGGEPPKLIAARFGVARATLLAAAAAAPIHACTARKIERALGGLA